MPLDCPIDAAGLESLASEHGTPLQIYDEAGIRENARALLKAFKARFPGFREFFAVKALPNPSILRVLLQEGCGMDCSSTAELHICEKLGVKPEHVMYTSNYTSEKDLGKAFDQGVVVNLDDASLVSAMVSARGRCPELMSFRLNPGLGRTDSETASNVLGGPEAKFGVPPDQILAAYRAAKEAGATRFGIHMMTGSCVLEPEYWIEIVERMFSSMGEIRRELGIEFEFVNIGGGLGIPYRPGVPSVCFDELAETVKRTWDASLARYDPEVASGAKPAPLLYMENGRCMTGPFGFLVSRCEAVKKVQYGGKHSVYYGLDANMANLMRPGMYGSYHHITVPAKEKTTIQEQWRLGVDAAERADADSSSETKAGVSAAAAAASGAGDTATAAATSKQAHLAPGRALCNVVGTLCENNDWFAKERDLPADASRGDLFVIHDTGAHSHSMGFQYNGKLRAPEVLIRSGDNGEAKGRVDLIRTRETIEGLYANTKIAQGLEEH